MSSSRRFFRAVGKLAVAICTLSLAPHLARAQIAADLRVDLASERSAQAGKGQPKYKSVQGETNLSLDANGDEQDACVPGDGRPSAAQTSGENRILSQSGDKVVIQLSSRSFAQGGHIRKCALCPSNTCVGISGEDTTSTAAASSAANVDVSVTSPLKRFQYDLFVGHLDTDGQADVSVTTLDGKQVSEIPNHPSHYLISESNREVIVHAEARTGATNTGGCCQKEDLKKSIVTVSLEPAAELDVNYAFKPFIAGGEPTTGYPYVVALGLNGAITCSGTYVGAHSVVTAAHCVYPVRESFQHKLDVRFGSRFDIPDQKFEVSTVQIPNDPAGGFAFNPETFEDDIALITFKGDSVSKPAEFYAGDPSWSNIVDKKLPVEIVGFGFNVIDNGKVGLGFKREAAISIARFENRKIFFGTQAANTCNGDSGGPLFVESPDGKALLLAGVTSGGDDKCTYGVDMRFDAFASWIKTRIQ